MIPNFDRIRSLLFDLDGTLLDSFPIHLEAYRRMFARFGIMMSDEKFLSSYSPNWHKTYEAFELPRELWDLADSYWLEEAARRQPDLYPGALDALTLLRESFVLGLVTSGSKRRVLRDIERTGIKPLLDAVITGDDVRSRKPAPEGLHLALTQLRLKPEDALYVGDAREDYEMASAAGVPFLFVASAFTRNVVEGPYIRVESVTEILGLLRKRTDPDIPSEG